MATEIGKPIPDRDDLDNAPLLVELEGLEGVRMIGNLEHFPMVIS